VMRDVNKKPRFLSCAACSVRLAEFMPTDQW
jgi:hypothetical protein